jgi:trafficking protein particle complex subunit 6
MAAAGPSTAPSLAALADPQSRLIDAAAMDYFLLEAVQTLRHSTAVAEARAKKVEDEMIDAGLIPPPPPQLKAKKDAQRDSIGAGSSAPSDDEDEGLRARLEAIGLHVGANITERCGDHIFLQRERRSTSKGCATAGLGLLIP